MTVPGGQSNSIDTAKLLAVIEKHSSTVTLNFLCDLMPVLNLRLKTSLIDKPSPTEWR